MLHEAQQKSAGAYCFEVRYCVCSSKRAICWGSPGKACDSLDAAETLGHSAVHVGHSLVSCSSHLLWLGASSIFTGRPLFWYICSPYCGPKSRSREAHQDFSCHDLVFKVVGIFNNRKVELTFLHPADICRISKASALELWASVLQSLQCPMPSQQL